jgi:hypothetical protein
MDDPQKAIDARRQFLLNQEQVFVAGFGLTWR